MHRYKVLSRLAILGTGVLSLALSQTGAVAATADTATSATSPMNIVAATRVLSAADANGSVQVELSNGAVVPVPAKYVDLVLHPQTQPVAKQGGVQPDGVVYGDCGYSYINLGYKSNGYPVRMTTGFHTNDASISYNWNAAVSGPPGSGYQYNYNASGNLNFQHDWAGSHNSGDDYPSGMYYASVSSNYSFALLYWGGICVSGGPTQATNL